jgi:hypothetical protein
MNLVVKIYNGYVLPRGKTEVVMELAKFLNWFKENNLEYDRDYTWTQHGDFLHVAFIDSNMASLCRLTWE